MKIEPGIYDIGISSFEMKSFVDIEGSGELVTTIRGNIDSDTAGVVVGADNAELRFLTVEHTGTSTYSIAIYNNAVSPRITGVTAMADQGTGIASGITNTNAASPTISTVRVSATSSGTGQTRAISNSGGSSPIMIDVTVQASSLGQSAAIHNTDTNTTPLMKNVVATATSGTWVMGCWNSSSAAPIMIDSTFTASGGSSFNHGIYKDLSATLNLTNVIARAFNGPSAIALIVANDGGGVLKSGSPCSAEPTTASETIRPVPFR